MKPKEVFLSNLAKLLNIKTIVELAIVFIYLYQLLRGIDVSDGLMMLATASFVDCLYTGAKEKKRWKPKKHRKLRKDAE